MADRSDSSFSKKRRKPSKKACCGCHFNDQDLARKAVRRMAESEQRHRHDMDRLAADRQYEIERRGQSLGILAVLLVLTFATVAALRGAVWPGAGIITIHGAAVAAIFVRTYPTKPRN